MKNLSKKAAEALQLEPMPMNDEDLNEVNGGNCVVCGIMSEPTRGGIGGLVDKLVETVQDVLR